MPNPTVIRLTADGRILVEGPVSRDQHPVYAAAALLNELLPGFDGPNGFKVPGGLRLVLARATHALDLPPFGDIGEFCAALQRFAAADAEGAVRGLFRAWRARQAVAGAERPHEITISDVRRARRATGLSLEDVAQAAAIPAVKLRELEWGYMRDWRADARGRDELRRYARASGLDEDLVISVAWPLIESAGAAEPASESAPAPASDTWALVPAHSGVPVPLPRPSQKGRTATTIGHHWAFAMAAAVLLVAIVLVAGWGRPARSAPVAETRTAVPRTEASTATPSRATPPVLRGDVRPASLVRPVTARPRPPQKAKSRPAPQQRKPFFQRELLRIVIR